MEWLMTGVLTDGQWAKLEPMVEACRPHRKTQHHDLRRTIEAIIWRCRNGAKWRSLPKEFGLWWMAAQTFIRWGRLGVWERLLTMAQGRGVQLGMAFLDGSNFRAHRQATGAPKRGKGTRRPAGEALGRSRGGPAGGAAIPPRDWAEPDDMKACVIADGSGPCRRLQLGPWPSP
jgi:transposase